MEQYYKIEEQKELKKKFEDKLNIYKLPNGVTSFLLRVTSAYSRITYWNGLKKFLEWKYNRLENITDDDLKTLTYIDFKCFLDKITIESELSQASINSILITLSSFTKHLYGIGLQDKNLMDFVDTKHYKGKIKKKISKMPSEKDIKRLEKNLENISNPNTKIRNLLMYHILKTVGLRISELVALNVSDIHFATGLDEDTISYINVLRKGSYSSSQVERTYLPDKLVDEIKEWLEYRKAASPKGDALFVSTNYKRPEYLGERIKQQTVKDLFRKYSENKISPHMLRHYAITMMIDETKDLSFVQEQVGHSLGSNVTMGMYATGLEESKNKLRNM